MDIDERIRRRQRDHRGDSIVVDYDRLSPVAHLPEPVNRGTLVERLLDHLDPAFDGALPSNGYLYGPKGSGKSAVVSSLFDRLAATLLGNGSVIHTATRTDPVLAPDLVYLDGRTADSEFALYRGLVDGLVGDAVPSQGVGTDWMRDRLETALAASDVGVVVAVDHVGEPDTRPVEWVADRLDAFDDVAWLAVGRRAPTEAFDRQETAVLAVDAYDARTLVEILMTRASGSVPGGSIGHASARRIAEWADGDAHDALAALLTAVDATVADGNGRVDEAAVTTGLAGVNRPCVSLGQVFALSPRRQRVLRRLADLDDGDRGSVNAAATAIAADPTLSLSAGTVERFLYQLAESDVVRRIPRTETSGKGRPPSRLECRFPLQAFRRLFADG